jgi:hypothetical protein
MNSHFRDMKGIGSIPARASNPFSNWQQIRGKGQRAAVVEIVAVPQLSSLNPPCCAPLRE